MSRIDEALRRSGAIGRAPTRANEPIANTLDSFSIRAIASHEAGHGADDRVPVRLRPVDAAPTHAPTTAKWTETEKLIGGPNMTFQNLEQYRRLAATLHKMQQDRGVKSVMVTSAQLKEGKTLTVANLCLTLSESYRRRVLMVDADLRRASLGDLLGVPHATGLAVCLRLGDEVPLRLVQVSDRLTLLPAGRSDSDHMAVLVSSRMRHIIEEASQKFDFVILDTPPVAFLPDAHLLASMVQATLFVIRAGSTPYSISQRAIDMLGRDRIAGVVLNGMDEHLRQEAGYYSYDNAPKPPVKKRWWFFSVPGSGHGQGQAGLGLAGPRTVDADDLQLR